MSDIDVVAGRDSLVRPPRGPTADGCVVDDKATVDWRRVKVACSLAASDAFVATSSNLASAAGFHVAWPKTPWPGGTEMAVSGALLIFLSLRLGLYENRLADPVELFRQRVLASQVFCACVVLLTGAQAPVLAQLAGWVVLVPATVVFGLMSARLVLASLKRLDLWQAGVVIIGETEDARHLSSAIAADASLGLRVIARVAHDDPGLNEMRAAEGRRADIAMLVSSGDGRLDARRVARVDVPVVVVVRDVSDLRACSLRTRTIGGVVGIEMRARPRLIDIALKRTMDLLAGSVLFLCSLPVVAVLTAAVWCMDRRNPFYTQPRIGHGGRVVRVWKVRSMFTDAEARLARHLAGDQQARAEWARNFKLTDDPRILPGVGRLMRRWSLDELPQLWNVLRGDMSLVGPRPFPAYHLSSFDEDFRRLRTSVPPGITGLWQVTSRSDGDLTAQESADTYYIRNWSIYLDLYILVKTLPAVIIGKGAR